MGYNNATQNYQLYMFGVIFLLTRHTQTVAIYYGYVSTQTEA